MKKRAITIEFIVTKELKDDITKRAKELGFSSRSQYIKSMIQRDLNSEIRKPNLTNIKNIVINGITVNISYDNEVLIVSGADKLNNEQMSSLGSFIRSLYNVSSIPRV